MVKAITFSVVAVLLLSCTSFAAVDTINNIQFIQNTLSTNVHSIDGAMGSAALNMNVTGLTQNATANTGATLAGQSISGMLGESGTAFTTSGGDASVNQTLGFQTTGFATIGSGLVFPDGQQQTVSGNATAKQTESLQVGATQDLKLTDAGMATGNNTVSLLLGQGAADIDMDPSTTVGQGIGVFGTQISSLGGSSGSDGAVSTNMLVVVGQYQTVQ
jgi:hypothetical protein